MPRFDARDNVQIGVRANAERMHPGANVVPIDDVDQPRACYNELLRHAMDWDFNVGEWYRVCSVMHCIHRGLSELSFRPDAYDRYLPTLPGVSVEDAWDLLRSVESSVNACSEEWAYKDLWMRF